MMKDVYEIIFLDIWICNLSVSQTIVGIIMA